MHKIWLVGQAIFVWPMPHPWALPGLGVGGILDCGMCSWSHCPKVCSRAGVIWHPDLFPSFPGGSSYFLLLLPVFAIAVSATATPCCPSLATAAQAPRPVKVGCQTERVGRQAGSPWSPARTCAGRLHGGADGMRLQESREWHLAEVQVGRAVIAKR